MLSFAPANSARFDFGAAKQLASFNSPTIPAMLQAIENRMECHPSKMLLGICTLAAQACVHLSVAVIFAVTANAEDFVTSNISKLQGDWFPPSIGGCYFDKAVLTIQGNEILVRIQQLEGLYGTITSLKDQEGVVSIGIKLTSPMQTYERIEIKLYPEGDGFRPLGIWANGLQHLMGPNLIDFWSLTRCPEASVTSRILGTFGFAQPYNPGPHKRVTNVLKHGMRD